MFNFQLFAILLTFLVSSNANPKQRGEDRGPPIKTIAVIRDPTGINQITGTVYLEQYQGSCVRINITLSGLSPGLHGFHIHQFGDLSNGCTSAGPHYNPFNMQHGAPNDTNRHAGDLGNVMADRTGSVQTSITDREVQLSGKYSVIGRAIVVHSGTDDLGRGTGSAAQESKITGNSGTRLGCGVIGIAST